MAPSFINGTAWLQERHMYQLLPLQLTNNAWARICAAGMRSIKYKASTATRQQRLGTDLRGRYAQYQVPGLLSLEAPCFTHHWL
jgi:hypothetical protein